MKYSLIIIAWNEPQTVSSNLEAVLDQQYDNLLPDFEIILVCPDQETYNAAKAVIMKYRFNKFTYIRDPRKGKPYAFNLAFEKARGDIIICTDGDVVIDSGALKNLVELFARNPKIGIVSGRPVSKDDKSSLFGYWGNLLADAAHCKRLKEFSYSKNYFVSGYLFAMRREADIRLPEDIMSDDAWISIKMILKGYLIGYAPSARVYVKYPTNLRDWFRQKRRSAGGYVQLKKFFEKGCLNTVLPKRNFFEELKFFFFPLFYAKNLRQFLYSLALYPVRLILWMIIFYDKIKNNQTASRLWIRIESTK
ncbi:MAG: hypothetical protein KatS3mg084_0033 [Candidatus Dojkabacteria bacterium]|nr:MAG: hypothetical protein KatS3mg084_0033 [Candidatus Dojkabacteria bacterium]